MESYFEKMVNSGTVKMIVEHCIWNSLDLSSDKMTGLNIFNHIYGANCTRFSAIGKRAIVCAINRRLALAKK